MLVLFTITAAGSETKPARERISIDVTIHVRAPTGSMKISDAYAAFVPPHRPWSRPAVEAIIDDGATLAVPVGHHRIVVAARGFKPNISNLRTLQENQVVEVVLEPLDRFEGTVRDAEGKPIAEARIGDVNAFIAPTLGRASELFFRHIVSTWTTASDHAGRWTLHAPSARNPIVAQKHGYQLAWSSPLSRSGSGIELRLDPGASLTIEPDRTNPGEVITLVPVEEVKGQVPAGWEDQIYGQLASGVSLRWPSLSPGRYEIYAQPIDPRTLPQAKLIGTVHLVGEESIVQVRLPPSLPNRARHSVFVEASPNDLAELSIYSVDTQHRLQKADHFLESVSGGSVVHSAGDEPVHLVSLTYIGIPDTDSHGDANVGAPARMKLLLKSRADLHLRTEGEQYPLPESAWIRFFGCEGRELSLPFTIQKDGMVVADAPAGCIGLDVRVGDFSPILISRSLEALKPNWLGSFVLMRAGRAVVQVLGADGSLVADATVSVSVKDAKERSVIALPAVHSQADGWAQLESLPVGRLLTISAEDESGATSELREFSVGPGEVEFLEPLRLLPPAAVSLKVELSSAFREYFPKSHIVAVTLESSDELDVRQRQPDSSGLTRFSMLRPGEWRATAVVRAESAALPIPAGTVELGPGEDLTHAVSVDPPWFRGRVVPWTAQGGMLDLFSTDRSAPVPAIPLAEDGTFVTILPSPGTYFARVRTRQPLKVSSAGEISFPASGTEVLIRLPKEKIDVRALHNGRPAAGLHVEAHPLTRMHDSEHVAAAAGVTDQDGHVELEALHPIQWLVSAEHPESRATAEKVVDLRNADAKVSVTLDLRTSDKITGTVRGAAGQPISGARVACLLPLKDAGTKLAVTDTSTDGSFELSVQGQRIGTIRCGVSSFAGHDAFLVDPARHSELLLPRISSFVEIRGLPQIGRFESLWLQTPDGRVVDVTPDLRHQAGTGLLVIPRLSPGRWHLVKVASWAEWETLASGARGLFPPLTEFESLGADRIIIDLREN